MSFKTACIVLSGAVVSLSGARAHAPSFQALGDLPGGFFSSNAWCVSPDGQHMAGGSATTFGTQACAWINGAAITALQDLPGNPTHCFVRGISNDGSVMVGYGNYVSSTAVEGVRWINSAPIGMGFPVNASSSMALGVSADGSVVAVQGALLSSGHAAGYRWTEMTGFEQLPFLNGKEAKSILHPFTISDDGSTIVGLAGTVGDYYHAFRWTEQNGTEGLDEIPGTFLSYAQGVSADGEVVVGGVTTSAGSQPFRWTTATGMVGLGVFPGASNGGSAYATNSDGSVVVGTYSVAASGVSQRASIWDARYGLRNLQAVLVDLGVEFPTGWTLGLAQDISADGRTIVGFGYNAQNNFEAFRVTLNGAGDATADGEVNVDDLLLVINNWGACPAPPTNCAGDISPGPFGDGEVNVDDLLMVINNWS